MGTPQGADSHRALLVGGILVGYGLAAVLSLLRTVVTLLLGVGGATVIIIGFLHPGAPALARHAAAVSRRHPIAVARAILCLLAAGMMGVEARGRQSMSPCRVAQKRARDAMDSSDLHGARLAIDETHTACDAKDPELDYLETTYQANAVDAEDRSSTSESGKLTKPNE